MSRTSAPTPVGLPVQGLPGTELQGAPMAITGILILLTCLVCMGKSKIYAISGVTAKPDFRGAGTNFTLIKHYCGA